MAIYRRGQNVAELNIYGWLAASARKLIPKPPPFTGGGFSATILPMNPVEYVKQVRSELGKVSWPTRSEVVKLTATVIILSAVIGIYLGVLDIAFSSALSAIIAARN